ncbi:MAG: cobalamin biosynthesis protein [Chloroflexi bacterium]|nr:cobalamin biosynthesis protein [Chloroflexota bacterium]
MNEALIIVMAVGIDLALGEPPAAAHPVVWMGKLIGWLERRAPARPVAQFWFGCGMLILAAAVFALPAYALMALAQAWHPAAYVALGALLLKSTFSVRELRAAALRVRTSLLVGRIGEARNDLRHLVSRDTSQLAEPSIVAATVESVAENVTDSLVAPLLFFLVLGVPGAVLYRLVNTFDAMIGYRGRYEYLGKPSARLDDAMNFIPARLAAILMVLSSAIAGHDWRRAWKTMARDHALTASPNAGWTMSAMAGALRVQLEKAGHYRLGDPVDALSCAKIGRAIGLMQVTAMLALLLFVFVEVSLYVRAS